MTCLPDLVNSEKAIAVLLLLALFANGCDENVTPNPSRLALWTSELRAAQPEDSFVAVYELPGRKLVHIAAKHSTDADSLTFKLIHEAYAVFDIDTVITEGASYSLGPNPPRLMKWAAEQQPENGFQPGGEAVPTIKGARRAGAVVWGGEPCDTDILDTLIAQGFSESDVLGFYTLRSVPQWVRERKIEDAGDPHVRELIEAELRKNRSRLKLSPDVLPGYATWEEWYASMNKKSFGKEFEPEEAGPLSNGPYGTNRIAAAISRARDSFLVERIADHLNRGETVMVVFGASHLMIVRRVLDDMLGQPCYVGSDLAVAEERCSD